MKKKDRRKTLENKIYTAISGIVKNEKALWNEKIEKTIKKLVKQILKKLSKKKNSSEKKALKKKASKTVKRAPGKNPLTARYKKIKTQEIPSPQF